MANQKLITQLQVFNFTENVSIRTIMSEDGCPWFVAADVCTALEIVNSRQAVSRLDEDEKGVTTNDTLGGKQTMATINESGLYSLILTSRKPEAKKFKKWVTSEVLPAIRKYGKYEVGVITPAQQNALQSIIADRVREGADAGKKRVYMWSRFNNHFKLGSYKQLPSTLFDEACDYLKAMPLTAKPMLALPDQTRNHLWLVLNDSGQVIESIPMSSSGEVRGQIDKHFPALALLDRQQVMADMEHLNMLMIETTSRMRNTLNPLITVLGTKTNATQADAEAFWQARLNQSADKLRAISG